MTNPVWLPAITLVAVLFFPFDTMSKKGVSVERLQCTSNKVMCTDPFCNFTNDGDLKYRISFGCKVVKDVDKLTVQVKTYYKTGGKKLRPGTIDISMDVCQLINGANNPGLTFLVPNLHKMIENITCPIQQGALKVENLLIEGDKIPVFAKGQMECHIIILVGKFTPGYTLKITLDRHMDDLDD